MYGCPVSITFRRSPLALTVLGVLEGGPLHPYGIQQRIKQWGKDEVVNVGQRATLYKVIARLLEAGLIAVHGTGRDQQYPERTTYEITTTGRAAVRQWLDEMISTPRNEYPEFPAALSFLPVLTPDATRALLEIRREQLVQRVAELDVAIVAQVEGYALPRVTILESEYLLAVVSAELKWVEGIISGLADGSLTWTDDDLAAVPQQS